MLNAKEEQTYVCTKSDRPWWTVGKEYNSVVNKYGELCFVDDDGDRWSMEYLTSKACNHVKLKETHSKVTMEDLKAKSVERKYTPCEVNKIIIKAYQTYNNDAQRLAFIKGYFAK